MPAVLGVAVSLVLAPSLAVGAPDLADPTDASGTMRGAALVAEPARNGDSWRVTPASEHPAPEGLQCLPPAGTKLAPLETACGPISPPGDEQRLIQVEWGEAYTGEVTARLEGQSSGDAVTFSCEILAGASQACEVSGTFPRENSLWFSCASTMLGADLPGGVGMWNCFV